MRFVLHYRGPLKSNGNSEHKHRLREHFDSQLASLWEHEPLKSYGNLISPRTEGRFSSLRLVGTHGFVPLVTQELHLVAEVAVTMLRPEPPGRLITQGGDIDNRLKTLFDALRMPTISELPGSFRAPAGGRPFFCLLEDDNLITSVSVRTEQLLEPASDSEVILLLDLQTRALAVKWGNSGLG